MRIFGVSPFFKLKNNTDTTVKRLKRDVGHCPDVFVSCLRTLAASNHSCLRFFLFKKYKKQKNKLETIFNHSSTEFIHQTRNQTLFRTGQDLRTSTPQHKCSQS